VANYPGLAHEAILRFDKLCHDGVSQTWYQSARLAVDYPSMKSPAVLCSTSLRNSSAPKYNPICILDPRNTLQFVAEKFIRIMSQSGASIHADCVTKFNELKLNKKIKYIIYKLDDNYKEIVVE